jgi:hypothetical protein
VLLGAIDVVLKAGLPSAVQESKQRRPFGGSRSTANHDDDAVMRLLRCEMEKVVPVAGQEDATIFVGKLEHGGCEPT